MLTIIFGARLAVSLKLWFRFGGRESSPREKWPGPRLEFCFFGWETSHFVERFVLPVFRNGMVQGYSLFQSCTTLIRMFRMIIFYNENVRVVHTEIQLKFRSHSCEFMRTKNDLIHPLELCFFGSEKPFVSLYVMKRLRDTLCCLNCTILLLELLAWKFYRIRVYE